MLQTVEFQKINTFKENVRYALKNYYSICYVSLTLLMKFVLIE